CRQEEVQEVLSLELPFLESCLRVNPKSYGAWHHRAWVLVHAKHTDWAKELRLCGAFLQKDERNFHCWDHRRFVVQHAGIPDTDELEYTSQLISTNFSNYSAWHYRSCLLPRIYPDPEQKGRVAEDQLLKEYELAQNAFFTDPSDQSAWFYHRWLLGRAEIEDAITCVYVSKPLQTVLVSFSKPVNLRNEEDEAVLFVDSRPFPSKWQVPDKRSTFSHVWVCKLPPGLLEGETLQHCLHVSWKDGRLKKECLLYPGSKESWCQDSATDQKLFSLELSIEKSSVLRAEMDSCRQLLDLEPENKWCLLTCILLSRVLDPLGHASKTLTWFKKLLAVDPLRTGYYKDLRSKYQVEDGLLCMEYAETRVLHLARKELTSLFHLDLMVLVTHLDVSGNCLHVLPLAMSCLQCLQVLHADDNEIEDIEGVRNLPVLQDVCLKNNRLAHLSQLQPLTSCCRLVSVELGGNLVENLPDFYTHLHELLTHTRPV
uniref:Geranylgeranyl transferase type-2 subunit alpha n=1 Tax=Eptatretus burgeri TaxID=7764 RepID=A0A8C4PXB5_EPTBU